MRTSRSVGRETCLGLALFALGLAAPLVGAQAPAVQVRDEPRHRIKMDTGKYRVYEVLVDQRDAMLFHEHQADNVAVFLSPSDITNEVQGGQKTDVSVKPGLVSFASASPTKPYVHRVLLRGGAPFWNITIELLQPPELAGTGDSPESTDPALAVLRESPRGKAYRLNLEPDQTTRLPSRASDIFVVCLSEGRVVQQWPDQSGTGWDCTPGEFRLLSRPRAASLKNEATRRVDLVVVAIQ